MPSSFGAPTSQALLESEISTIDKQTQELGAKKVALTEGLAAVTKSLGTPTGRSERPTRQNRRKAQKALETQVPTVLEVSPNGGS